ncbi:MAG: endolytic transglycosylase MltG [Spirochaetota bacterium]
MKTLQKLAVLLLSCSILAVVSGYALFAYMNSAPGTSRDFYYTVHSGETLRSVATSLYAEGLIRNADFFVLLSRISQNRSVRTGRYRIPSGASSTRIYDILSSGRIETVRVTVPEGYNIYQIAPALEDAGICDGEEFLRWATDREFLETMGIDAPSVEGYLYPDTYSFAPDTAPYDVIRHMKKTMDGVLDSLDANRHIPKGMSVHELLIVASLVEKEARIKSEQRLIASVFLNRIERGMRFDSDPTVRYAVKKFTGRIRYRDLEADSPYNTYRVWGYPPTPIASPGREAIDAVLRPAESTFLYFVARNDGSHYFSSSLSRHNKAVEYYQKGIQNGFNDDQL